MRSTPKYIIIKMPEVKYKEGILKAARENQLVTYNGAPIRLAAVFSKETMQDLLGAVCLMAALGADKRLIALQDVLQSWQILC